MEFRDRNIDSDCEARETFSKLRANNQTPGIVIGSKQFVGFTRNLKAIRKELGIQ